MAPRMSANLRAAVIAAPVAAAAIAYAALAPQHSDDLSPSPENCFASLNKTMDEWADEYPTHNVELETADEIRWQVEGARSTTVITFVRNGDLWTNRSAVCL